MNPTTLYISIGFGIITALVALVWHNLVKRVDDKLDKDMFAKTLEPIEKSVDGINGTAQKLHDITEAIIRIRDDFMTRTEFDLKMRIHCAECEKNGKRENK